MGFLPYVATKCTANKKKKPPRKVFLYQVQTDTLFHNGTAAKRPSEQVQQIKFSSLSAPTKIARKSEFTIEVQQTFERTGAAC